MDKEIWKANTFQMAQTVARGMSSKAPGKEYYVRQEADGQWVVYEREQKAPEPEPAPVITPSETMPIESVVDVYDDYWERAKERYTELFEAEPFAFDEALAKESATAEYEPYYSELLEDYLADVGIKRETIQDEVKLLEALRTTPEGFAGEATRAYERAVSQAEEGFAGRGMFFSGIKKTAMGAGEVEREYGVKEVARGVQRKERGLERKEEEAIETGVLQRRGEAWKEWLTPRVMAYQREFPAGATPSMAGYLSPEYLRY